MDQEKRRFSIMPKRASEMLRTVYHVQLFRSKLQRSLLTRLRDTITQPESQEAEKSEALEDTPAARPERVFWTNSRYTGEWNSLGMSGRGVYTMPHCVVYEGEMFDSMFHGKGVLKYPDGSKISGEWYKGKMTSSRYVFPDGLEFESGTNWEYCTENDRRFWRCIEDGMRPAGRTPKTNLQPTRVIPPRCYDTEEGFYDPKTRCLLDPEDETLKTVLRVPTDKEVKWIEKHCRRAWTENSGFRPSMYRDWQDLHRDLKPKASFSFEINESSSNSDLDNMSFDSNLNVDLDCTGMIDLKLERSKELDKQEEDSCDSSESGTENQTDSGDTADNESYSSED